MIHNYPPAPTASVLEVTTTARIRRAGQWLLESGGDLLHRLWRTFSWVFRSKWRMLSFAWLAGFFFVGQVELAAADDGLITGPDLGSAGGQTVFERFGPEKFTFNLQLSDSHHGGLGIEEGMWTILHAIENGLMYLIAAMARGAITSMEWMLNLTLYSDNANAIDSAVQQVANQVFWPLFGTTMAIGAMVAYGRMKREGNGSLWNDASWLIAASVLAATFATAPSLALKDMDNTRSSLGSALMVGYSNVAPVTQSAAGFPAITTPKDQKGATRQLADGMWNVFVVTPWCYGNFNSMDICKDVGKDYLTQDARWQGFTDWMAGRNGGNSDDDNGQAYCPKELNAQCDWIRGQSFGRLGAVLFILVVTIPLVVLLLALVLFGIMAIIGFLLLALAGIIFLLFWMIPGRPRQIGVRWLEELIGSLLQSLIITTVIGSVMVLDSFLSAGIPKYGFFGVAILNLATFVTGFRMRGRLENVVGMGAGSGASPFSGYMAMRAVGALGKSVSRVGKRAAGQGVSAAKGTYRAGQDMASGMRDTSPLAGGAVADLGQRMRSGGTRVLAPLRKRTPPANPKGTSGSGAPTADRPPNQPGGTAATRPGGSSGPGSTGPSRNGARPARHRSTDDDTTRNTATTTPDPSTGGRPDGPRGGTGTSALPLGSAPKGGKTGSVRSAPTGTVVARTSNRAGSRQRSSTPSTASAPGGSRGGQQHTSPPARTGSAPAVRKGQPTVSEPERALKPLKSRPTPTVPRAAPTPAPRASNRSTGGPPTGFTANPGDSTRAATPPAKPSDTNSSRQPTPRPNRLAAKLKPQTGQPRVPPRRTPPTPPRTDRPRRSDDDQSTQR